MRQMTCAAMGVGAALVLRCGVGMAEYAWWEAETPQAGRAPATWLAPASERERDALSGGDWLQHVSRTGSVAAVYDIAVPSNGVYQLWIRGFGPARGQWRVDEGGGAALPASLTYVDRDVLDIRADRYFTVAWARVGETNLLAGRRAFRLELDPSEKPVAIDCLALVRGEFRPYGKAKPGETLNRAPEGWFGFEPAPDRFEATALDLSRLNESPAGSQGWVVRKGPALVFEKSGAPVRFWGVTACADIWALDHAAMDYLAKRLAKMGVNMVRLHVAPYYETSRGPQTEGVHYLVAALKRNGIYSGVSWYCSAVCNVRADWRAPGLPEGQYPFAAHLVHEPLQASYRAWATNLLGSVNPYTGTTLGSDPSVAMIELIDEDNLFFWTFKPEGLPAVVRQELERRFGAWASARHGSIAAALAAWGEGPRPAYAPDRPAEGLLSLYGAGQLGGAEWAVSARNPLRAADQLRFMVELQSGFYADMRKWLGDALGFRGIVVGTNWKTADERVLGPLDKYSEVAVLDATARNTYFSGPSGKHKFFPWEVGMAYRDASLLLAPEQAITMHVPYNDKPHLMTEGGYAMPNRFRTEEQLVMATYASLQGVDGLFPFQLDGDWLRTMRLWPVQTPATFGQYPAAALIYREGLVAEGPVVVDERLRADDLYAGRGAAVTQPLGLDEGKRSQVPEGLDTETLPATGVDPLAFYVGRVVRTVGDEAGALTVRASVREGIDRENGRVRSATGEALLDFKRGLLTLGAARAQGATGWLQSAGRIDLPDVTIASSNEYGSVMLVPLDGKTLATSRRMLLQVMSEEKNYGWTTRPVRAEFAKGSGEVDALEIADVGGRPLVVRELSGVVSLKRPDAAGLAVTALDANGYPTGKAGSGERIDLQPRTLYYLIGE